MACKEWLLLIVVSLALGACLPRPEVGPTVVDHPGPSVSPPTETSKAVVPPTDVSYAGCYYVWSTLELPELSREFDAALNNLGPGASGSAYAFGEDCTRSDGSRTFSAMETDFRAKVGVSNLHDENILGNSISNVMSIVLALPTGDVPGAHPGRVEFEFVSSDGQSLRVQVDIARYRSEGTGIRGARLWRMFYSAP
jgi:hypothetical protein